MVARLLREQEGGGSNPLSPTFNALRFNTFLKFYLWDHFYSNHFSNRFSLVNTLHKMGLWPLISHCSLTVPTT